VKGCAEVLAEKKKESEGIKPCPEIKAIPSVADADDLQKKKGGYRGQGSKKMVGTQREETHN